MTSSMLAGEKRRASARRGGMTVLGKVVVPKPLNLPSQRLENHGVDPHVDIVPKSTLSWGSRSSSSASNAWGSSTLSPNADGGTRSPSQLSGRPSSGSGTRPSTAGSDRTHEPSPNAWGQTSRPSSASGISTSNQTALTSLRPRSAETRPGSSQLSRFAEPSSDNSVTWGPTDASQKLGVTSSKNDGFSMSSGDFPLLGSERDNSGKRTDSQDHSRPGSSSGRAASEKVKSVTSSVGDITANANVKGVTADTWRLDGSQHVTEDGVPPTVEKWHANVPPQHFDAWHGPLMNPPPGVWYGGPPVCPPYGTPIAPNGFPMEPFPYYHPQIPHAALANSQLVPPPGTGPRGHHPKSGDLYRPHTPDVYIRPEVPVRPGFYPGPLPYEGYYGPFMGMAAGPAVYHRYPGENAPDPGNNYPRPSVHGHLEKTAVSEQVESGHSDDSQGPYKVLLKQHNELDERRGEGKWEHVVPAHDPNLEKGGQLRKSAQKHEWGLDDSQDEEDFSGKTVGGDGHSQNLGNCGTFSSDYTKVNSPEIRGKAKAIAGCSVNKSENAASTSPQLPRVFTATPRDLLIQKVEGLAAKARGSDVHPDVTSISRRAGHGAQDRLGHHGKRLNAQDSDGWRKKPLAVNSIGEAANSEPSLSVPVRDRLTSVEASEKSGINLHGKDEGESLTPIFEASDSQAERAKKRELAKQRAKQLQEEEEERMREQKAKSLAKLEELNRCTQTTDGSNQKLEKTKPSGRIQHGQEESGVPPEPAMVARSSETPSSALVSCPNAQIIKSSIIKVGEFTVLSEDTLLETPDNVNPDSSVSHGQPLPLQQVNEGGVSRHKRMGYKQKKNIPLRNYPTDVAANNVDPVEVVADEVGPSVEPSLPMNSNIIAEASAQQRRKNNRSSKIKHKVDDAPEEANAAKVLTEGGTRKTFELELDLSLVQSRAVSNHAIQTSEQHPSLPGEEACGRVHNLGKSQHPRWMQRNQQANRKTEKIHSSDAVIWAPVRSQDKSVVMDEASKRTEPEIVTITAKSENVVQNNLKGKRAEMERYVPKPVAEDLALQDINQTLLDCTVGRKEPSQNVESSEPSDSATGVMGSTVESRNVEGKKTKQSKTHGSWRQKGSVESAVLDLHDGSSSISNPRNNVQKSIAQYQPLKSDINSLTEQTKSSDDWNTSDGWNSPDNSETVAPVKSVVVKDVGAKGRGRQHPFKGHRTMGNSYDMDQRNASGGDTYKTEIVQTDKNITSKETRGVEERKTSHWQPKSQSNAVHNQRANRTGGSEVATAEVSDAVKKHSPSRDRVQPPIDQSLSEHKIVAESPNVGHQESKRERTVDSFRGRPFSPNQNNRSGQDNRQHGNAYSNRGRPRPNSQYEYQPIGQYNNKSNDFEGPANSPHDMGSRYRERSQGHSRRGEDNFYGRQSGTVRVDARYD